MAVLLPPYHALSGLLVLFWVTQGVALGWYVAPLWGFGAGQGQAGML
jgi:hypothetical protein